MTMNEHITNRIRDRLEATGMTPRAASMRATGKPDAIRTILNQGVMPSAERLDMIAVALGTSTAYLLGATEDPSPISVRLVESSSNRLKAVAEPSGDTSIKLDRDHIVPKSALPRRTDMPQDIPVYGTAIGTSQDIQALENGEIAVEQTSLNTGEVIDYFRRPPGLTNARKAYGLYVVGFSMEPAYEPGGVIIVDPSRPPAIQDYVVVYMRGAEHAEDETSVSAVLLKRLVRRSASFVELEQFNPPARFRIGADAISQMHRVLPLAEIVGV